MRGRFLKWTAGNPRARAALRCNPASLTPIERVQAASTVELILEHKVMDWCSHPRSQREKTFACRSSAIAICPMSPSSRTHSNSRGEPGGAHEDVREVEQ